MQFLLPKTVQLVEGVISVTLVPQEWVQDLLCIPSENARGKCSETSGEESWECVVFFPAVLQT